MGNTDEKDTGMGIGQGTTDCAIISAVSLDNGVKEIFGEDNHENDHSNNGSDSEMDGYKDMFHPILFQDDLGKASENVDEAQKANDKMEDLLESKLLDFNIDKSVGVVIGDAKARKKILLANRYTKMDKP